MPVFHDETTRLGPARPSGSLGVLSGWSDPEPTRRTPAPQAAPPELPERPLFADGPARPRTRDGHPGDDSDALTGTGWSGGARHRHPLARHRHRQRPGAPGLGTRRRRRRRPDDPETGSWDAAKPGTSWLRLAAVLAAVLVLVVGVVLAFNLGRGSGDAGTAPRATSTSPSGSSSRRASTPVAISGVTDFDPQGDPPEENPDLAPLAADGKQSTAWRTSTYYDELAKLKDGVGLLVDLGKPTEVGKVRVNLLGDGTSLDVLAAPDAQAAPSSTDGLDTVASTADAGSRANLTLKKPVTTQWLVVWLTTLPSTPGGFQGRVAEISVSS